jgi:mono/diheme cytochrome c family protein
MDGRAMKRLGKILLACMAVLVLLVAATFGTAWWSSERAMARQFVVADPPLPPADDSRIDHGRHIFETRGCADCHGLRGEGRVVMDVPPVRMVASNLTSGGVGGRYHREAIARAVRHGVGHDGRPLRLMPAIDYAEMSDGDVAALADFLATLPSVDHDPGQTQIRWLGRLLYLAGQIDLVPAEHVDHAPRARAAPAVAMNADYGGYLAHTCRGCHGADYRGQRVPGTPPELPPASDLTALDTWRDQDFLRVMREGIRPDGRVLHPLMPWQAFRTMTDEELGALWLYFDSLSGAPTARRG